jgi:hypothetical protein
VVSIAKGLGRLSYLDIRNIHGHIESLKVGDEGATVVARHLPLLAELHSRKCSIGECGAIVVSANLQGLSEFDLSNMWAYLAYNDICINGALAAGHRLSRPAVLYLRKMLIHSDDCGIKDVAALNIARSLKKLKSLYLGTQLVDAGENGLSKDCQDLMKTLLPGVKIDM